MFRDEPQDVKSALRAALVMHMPKAVWDVMVSAPEVLVNQNYVYHVCYERGYACSNARAYASET